MEDESTSILLNNTFSALNSREARQLQVKPIGSKWVYKTKHNPDGSTRYKARLVIKGYEQTDFVETYAPVGKLTTFQYLISLIGRYGWNMDHLDVVTVTVQKGTKIFRANEGRFLVVSKELCYGTAERLEDAEEAARGWRYNLVR
jgi:hypothetical protein